MYVYVKLRPEYDGKKIEHAIYVCGSWIYPGDNRWINYRESDLESIKSHRDFEMFDIKSENEYKEIVESESREIEDIVLGQWKQSEKRIALITDQNKLEKIQKRAAELKKNKIAEIARDRIEELGEVN